MVDLKYRVATGPEVRMKGLEPIRLSAPDPKSGTATNYATSACKYVAPTGRVGAKVGKIEKI